MGEPISALYAAVCDWAGEHGLKGDGKSVLSFDGPDDLTVRLNTSKEKLDGIPPFAMVIENGGFAPVAMCNPYGGVVMQLTEQKIIQKFRVEEEQSND